MTAVAFADAPFNPAPSLQEVAAAAFRHRIKLLAALVLPLVLAVAALLVLPAKYRAQSDVMVKTGHEYMADAEGADGLTAPTSTKQEGINSEVALLGGRAVVSATIAAIGLAKLYPGLVKDPPWFGSVEDAAVYKFHKDLTVEPVKLSTMITVSFDASSPELARQALDRLIQIFVDKHTQVFDAGHAESYAGAIDRGLADLGRLEQQRTQIKRDNSVYDIASQRSALITQRVATQAHLLDVSNQAATLTQRLDYLTQALPGIDRTTRSTVTDRNESGDYTQRSLTDLRSAVAALLTRYGASYPDVRRVQNQIAALERAPPAKDRVNTAVAASALALQVQAEIVMDHAQLAPLMGESARYEGLLVTLDAELQRLEQVDLGLRTLGTRIEALTDDLKAEQSRYDQARIQEEMERSQQVSTVQVAPAMAADRAVSPKKLVFLAAGLLLGLFGSGGIVLLEVLAGNTILTEHGAERLLGLPVLVSLPLVAKRGGPVTLPIG